ncbi:hypothetical protein [Haladaptatus sp. T7]|uniref:hypothetical protein n=1 Tax=Haladaptatus sp. T7 TaxID=2029368 RepID=UPI0021A25332|nr:hypothetical protein [Haladaptatus sp. T7]GKZ15890.1 hypothetical protein HAL_37710 [Haladaptatus sp. T7]
MAEEPERDRELEKQYLNEGAHRSTLASRGHDVLAELAAHDIIARPSPEVFDLDTKLDSTRVEASWATDGWTVTEYTNQEDVRTAHLMFSKTTDEYDLTLHIQPQAGKEYALVESKSSGEEFAIDPSLDRTKFPLTTDGDVQASSCSDSSYCTDNSCLRIGHPNGTADCYATRVHTTCNQRNGECRCYSSGEDCPARSGNYICYTSCA